MSSVAFLIKADRMEAMAQLLCDSPFNKSSIHCMARKHFFPAARIVGKETKIIGIESLNSTVSDWQMG